MARPQSPDYDKRRDAILAAAAHLYARRGFQGASVADLAKACSTSKSLIYHYFPSKDDCSTRRWPRISTLWSRPRSRRPRRERREPVARAHPCLHAALCRRARTATRCCSTSSTICRRERRAEVVAKQRRIIARGRGSGPRDPPRCRRLRLPLTMLFFGMINWTHNWFRPGGAARRGRRSPTWPWI